MLKVQNIFFILIYLLFDNVNAQKEANVWMIERGNGIDFNGDSVQFIDGCILGNNESSSSICDNNGNLLFYSNGITLYNRFHQVVKNGTDLGFSSGINETSSVQGTLLLSHVDNDSMIYLFSTDFQGRGGGLVYSTINIHDNNDSGEVISKKNKLTGRVNEPVSAVNHQNGRDIWIIVHGFGNSLFHLFLLKKDGLMECTIENSIGAEHYMSGGHAQVDMKFSPNGEYITHHQALWGNTETFRFNSQTGRIYDTLFLNKLNYVFGMEHSPNHRYLYLTQVLDSGLIQIDLINKKKKKIAVPQNPSSPMSLQLGIDGKIYGSIYNSKDLLVIEQANKVGDSCNAILKQNFFINTIRKLPNFNQSHFCTPAINYNYEMNCTKNSIQFWGKDTFGANSHTWHIKKLAVSNWQLIGSTKNINYTFADTGTYEVRYIASNGNKADTVVKSIVLYDKIKQGFLGKDTAYAQGDLINKTLFAPVPNHCVRWYFDKLSTGSIKEKGSSSSLLADSVGKYICKVTNQAFCEVWDTIVISECINNLNQPSLFRSRDTLRTFHLNADSFVWYRNNEVYKITKQPFLALTDTGTYRVEAAKKGHCNSSSIGTNYVQRLNVNRINIEDLGIRVFPNPSNGVVRIESNNSFKFEVFDISGRVINKGENNKELTLPKGIYFLRFDVSGYKFTEKVVVW